MKISPIIHTRLYNCDYNLVVKPADISANDLDWIKKHIFYSNKSMDFLDGERWVVLDNGDYRIAGLVGFLKDISNHCDLSLDEKEKSEKLFRDSKDRSIYGFIGIVIKDLTDEDKSIIPTYDYLWKMFVENISPIFDSPMPKSIEKEFGFAEYNVNSILSSDKYFDIPKEHKVFFEKKIVYTSTPKSDYELFKHVLTLDGKDFSFCSNISRIGDISDSIFSIITTSQSCYSELERVDEEARKAKERAEKEEERKKREEAEEKARKEEEEVRRREEEERKKVKEAEEEERRKAEEAEEEEKRKEEEERRRAEEEEEEEYRRKREERKRRQEEERRRAEEAEEEERKKREEERRKAEEAEEEAFRKKIKDRQTNRVKEDIEYSNLKKRREQDSFDFWDSDFGQSSRNRGNSSSWDREDINYGTSSPWNRESRNYGNSSSVKNKDYAHSDYKHYINRDKYTNQEYNENQKRWLEEADSKERERQKELKRQEQEIKRKLEEERQKNSYNWYNPDSSNKNTEDIDISKIVKIIPKLIDVYLPNDDLRKEFVSKFKKAISKGAVTVKIVFKELLELLKSFGINIDLNK